MEKAKTFALLLFAASLLAGCGGNENSSQTNTGGGSTESSELTSSSEESSSSGESSSSESEFDRSDTYAIFFHSQGGSEVETQYVEPGETASEPEDPSYDGHTFLGWYLSEEGDDLFDFSTIIESDYHLYAHWAEDGQQGEPIPMTIYFRDASWWSVADAVTYIKLGNDASDYGVPMEKLRFCNDEYQGVGYNYWKFEIEDITDAKTAQFVRMGEDGSYWSAWTDKAILSQAGESNMYDIRSSEELWSEPVEGSWAVYDENDMGNEDAPEPPAELNPGYYVVGSMNGWAASNGYKLYDNPNNPGELMILDVYLEQGDEFKIHDTTPNTDTWLGVSSLNPECPALDYLGGTDNIVVLSSGYYDFYVKDGIIWATADIVSYNLALGPDFEAGEALRPVGGDFVISTSLEQGDELKLLGPEQEYGYSSLLTPIEQLGEGEGDAIAVLADGYFTFTLDPDSGISAEYESTAPEKTTIYFADEEWWNTDEAEPRVSLDGSPTTLEMTFLRECPNVYIGEGYKYWSIEIAGLEDYQTIEFIRSDPATGEDWGASTGVLDLSLRGENNLYSIRGSAAAWKGDGAYVEGEWQVYDPTDMGNPDAIERPAREVYLSGTFGGEEDSIPFLSHTASEVKLLDVTLEEGDSFVIEDVEGGITAGYSSIKGECPLKANFTTDLDNSIIVSTAGTYDFYFDFTIGTGLSVWIG